MNIEALAPYLPQKDSFLLLDEIIDHDFMKSVVIKKTLLQEDPIFKNHFPDNPIYPGSYLIEMSAQAAQLIFIPLEDFLKSNESINQKNILRGRVLKVENVKFIEEVKPGQTLEAQVVLNQFLDSANCAKISFKITCLNKVVAKGKIMLGFAASGGQTDENKKTLQ